MCIFAVTPLAGVWIEIISGTKQEVVGASLPLRECGLKSLVESVPPCATGHSPCGSVD